MKGTVTQDCSKNFFVKSSDSVLVFVKLFANFSLWRIWRKTFSGNKLSTYIIVKYYLDNLCGTKYTLFFYTYNYNTIYS